MQEDPAGKLVLARYFSQADSSSFGGVRQPSRLPLVRHLAADVLLVIFRIAGPGSYPC
jgi:hypothetical protein